VVCPSATATGRTYPVQGRAAAAVRRRRPTTKLDGNCGGDLQRCRRVLLYRLVLSVVHSRSLDTLRVCQFARYHSSLEYDAHNSGLYTDKQQSSFVATRRTRNDIIWNLMELLSLLHNLLS